MFQRGPTLHCGSSAAAPSRLEKPKTLSKKPKAELKKSKYKSTEFIFDSPSPLPSPPTTSKSTTWPQPHWIPQGAPPSAFSKPPAVKLPSDMCTQSSPAPPAHHAPPELAAHQASSLEPHQASTSSVALSDVKSLACMTQPLLPSNSGCLTTPSQDQQQQPPLQIPTDQATQPFSTTYYDSAHHLGPHVIPSFPTQYFKQPVVYHPQHTTQPLQEGGSMPRCEGQLLPMGGHHILMGGQSQMCEGQLLSMGGGGQMHMQMGGIPVQWQGGGMYYTPSMAYADLSYGYPPPMAQQQLALPEPLYFTHHPAGDYAHSAPEHKHHQG